MNKFDPNYNDVIPQPQLQPSIDFWFVFAEDHTAHFGLGDYRFVRFKSEEEAAEVAKLMARRHKKQFHVMARVKSFRPAETPLIEE